MSTTVVYVCRTTVCTVTEPGNFTVYSSERRCSEGKKITDLKEKDCLFSGFGGSAVRSFLLSLMCLTIVMSVQPRKVITKSVPGRCAWTTTCVDDDMVETWCKHGRKTWDWAASGWGCVVLLFANKKRCWTCGIGPLDALGMNGCVEWGTIIYNTATFAAYIVRVY